ncbi:unnamed protein product [Sphagnum jensenii]
MSLNKYPLFDAIKNVSCETHYNVIELIKAATDVNAADEDGQTPLHRASNNGWGNNVIELIKARADVNVRDKDGQTPLHLASNNGWGNNVIELIKAAAADVNVEDEYGNVDALSQSGATLEKRANPEQHSTRANPEQHSTRANPEQHSNDDWDDGWDIIQKDETTSATTSDAWIR